MTKTRIEGRQDEGMKVRLMRNCNNCGHRKCRDARNRLGWENVNQAEWTENTSIEGFVFRRLCPNYMSIDKSEELDA